MAQMTMTIPLDCTICPKKPKFSDVSHLLTHIGSKGHLSHYYKLKIKANTDPASFAACQTYDTWYTQWGVEDLMSDRMSLKDKKKPRKASRASSVASSSVGSSVSQPRARGRPPGSGKGGSNLRAVQTSNAVSNSIGDLNYNHNNNLSMAPAPQWPPAWPRISQPSLIPLMSRPASAFEGYSTHFGRAPIGQQPFLSRTPSTFSAFDDTTSNSILSSPPEIIQTPSITDDSSASVVSIVSTGSNNSGDTSEDKSKLKGVQWPGMSIFDSATPEAKRKRNQKKDAGVIERLEYESRDIEATEQVWSPGGNLKRQKLITGMPSDSPTMEALEIVTPPPKRPRAALTQLHPRRSTRVTQLERPSTMEDDEIERDLTYGKPRRARQNKRRRGLNVYEDKVTADEDQNGQATFGRARFMSHLTRSFEPDQKENIRPQNNMKFEFNKYINIDDDDFGSQAMYGKPIHPQRFHEALSQRQQRFSMAQPMSQPTMPITVPIDLTGTFGDSNTGMFGPNLGRIYDHTVSSWPQASDYAPSHGLAQVTTPQNSHFLNMMPPSGHWRNSSNDIRTPFPQAFARHISVTSESPLRRTQSMPLPMSTFTDAATYIENAAQADAAIQALTDAAILIDGTTPDDGLNPDVSMKVIDIDDDDRTLTDLPSSAQQ